MMEIHLNASQVPVEAMYSQHHGGELCGWSHVSLTSDGRPIDYVAEGSHANYYTSGAHNLGYPDVYDYANGDGEVVDPGVVDTASNPSWLAWPGQWGGSDASPTGPAQDPHASQWYDPLAWEANDGNSCTAGERGFMQARRDRGIAARGPATTPPNPRVRARIVGKRVLIRYRFDSWPTTRARRPWQLITTLRGAEPQYVPLTSHTVIRRSSGLIQQRIGLDDRRLRLLVSVRARNGGRSKTFAVPIR
jgi:hypothetical protein